MKRRFRLPLLLISLLTVSLLFFLATDPGVTAYANKLSAVLTQNEPEVTVPADTQIDTQVDSPADTEYAIEGSSEPDIPPAEAPRENSESDPTLPLSQEYLDSHPFQDPEYYRRIPHYGIPEITFPADKSVLSQGHITITWTDIKAPYYEIEIREVPSGRLLQNATVEGTSYELESLIEGQQYEIYVGATTERPDEDWARQWALSTVTVAKSGVSKPVVTEPANGVTIETSQNFKVSWDPVPGATGYAIYYSNLSFDYPPVKVATVGQQSSAQIPITASEGNELAIYVAAIKNGIETWSDPVKVIAYVPPVVPPEESWGDGVFPITSPQNGEVVSLEGDVKVTWLTHPDAVNYLVYLEEGTTLLYFKYTGIASELTLPKSYLVSGHEYLITVWAIFPNGYEAPQMITIKVQ